MQDISIKHHKAMVHIDLDGSKHIYRVHNWPYKLDHDILFETGLQRALAFLNKTDMHATLFVIAEDLDNPQKFELLKEAAKQGHEIASHSLTHRKLTELDRDNKRREIFESRERLAVKLNVEVNGFRAPYFDIDQESLEFIAEAGYSYDSSLFSDTTFACKAGVQILRESFSCQENNSSLVELALPAYKPLPFPFHPSYSLVFGTWYFRLGLRKYHKTGEPLVLLFHLTDFADPLPAEHLNGWKTSFYTLSFMRSEQKFKRCEGMLDIVRQKYQIVDTMELLRVSQK